VPLTPASAKASDPSHDFLRAEPRPLDALFRPERVAVIGATERQGSVGRTVLENLLAAFRGKVFPVNPTHPQILDRPAYASIAAVPEKVDLAIVVTPAATVPEVIGECVDAGVRAAVVISAGFKEHGAAGVELERRILQHLRRGRMRLIGPNCVGVMNPLAGLNATFLHQMARPGNVAFLSQSGALLAAILDWSLKELVGFSAFVSTGSMLDVGWGDLIYYFGDDPNTQSILIYMESIGDARSFLSAAREVAFTKPIIVIKSGRTEAASRAAASHTGSLTGSDDVLDAAFRRSGVLRVNSIGDLFNMAEVLSKQPRPRGPRLTILTNAGGPGVLATDALIAAGGELAAVSQPTLHALDQLLPPHWSHSNPVDVLGDADSERYIRALEITAADPASDGLLVIVAPQGMADPTQTAERLTSYARAFPKPILASFMGGESVTAAMDALHRAGIPTFAYPDTAARAFEYMWRSSYNLRALYETPALTELQSHPSRRADAEEFIQNARDSARTLLTEAESKQLLQLYGIPTVETRVARSESEAVQAAREIGYPVALKLLSHTITHKSDVGGVKLDLRDHPAVRAAFGAIQQAVAEQAGAAHFLGVTVQPMIALDGYELILGSSLDPQFGPVMLFGLGGQLVEVFRDRALALPPLNTTLARRLMERTRIFTALQGVRGRKPVDLTGLEALLVRFSQLVVEQRWIKEIDINPLLASSERLLALDARVVLHEPQVSLADVPPPAIRPYPSQYVSTWVMKDGTAVTIRPIRPEDEPQMVRFHQTLSERSVYMRYFQVTQLSTRVAHERLVRICFIDYDREMALVAERNAPNDAAAGREILGVGRLSKLHGRNEAEFAVLVSDLYQRHGLGFELMRRLTQIARDEKLERVTGNILPENKEMQGLARKAGFEIRMDQDLSMYTATLSV
jgi:acetyltransferase